MKKRSQKLKIDPTKVYHSKHLNLRFINYTNGTVHFEDQVDYTINEVNIIKKMKLTGDDIVYLHEVKKMFKGEIVNVREDTFK